MGTGSDLFRNTFKTLKEVARLLSTSVGASVSVAAAAASIFKLVPAASIIYVSAGVVVLASAVIAQSIYSSWKLLTRLRHVEAEREAQWTPEIEVERAQLRDIAEDSGDSELVKSLDASRRRSNNFIGSKTVCLAGIELENIRCFRKFALALEDSRGPYLTTILLGDNSAGKSTILRSIAVGLCPESEATSLINSISGSFLREGEDSGHIKLHVRSYDRTFEGLIHTSIERLPSGEIVRQITEPRDFPWDRVFVCGYGTHRSTGRPTSHERYSAREAVGTLFSDTADLLNPEVVLLRRDQKTRRRLEKILTQILLLERTGSISTDRRGVQVRGPWGTLPIAAMSDGYRSTTQWVLDYLGWQVFADRLNSTAIDGTLLIDELEQHLHPRWQRHIVQRLRAQFDETQLIASTHTPLVAAGVADLPRSQVVRLMPTRDGTVEPIIIPAHELTGKRADQILADAFGLVTSKSPGSIAKIDRFTELVSRDRTGAEQQEFQLLKKELEDGWSSGDSEVSRQADRAVSQVLDVMIEDGQKRQIVDAQVRERLADLFGKKEPAP